MAGGTNQYSDMNSMKKAQRFAREGKMGRAHQAWTGGGGDWTGDTHRALKELGGIGSGRLQQALRFGQGGMFGRAKEQIGRGGGEWGDPGEGVGGLLRGLLRDYLRSNPDADVGEFNYGDISDADLAQAQRFAGAGMMGRAKGLFGDAWSGAYGKRLNTQLQADAARNPYEKGTSMGFDWGDATDEQVAAAKEAALAGTGKMGKAAKAFGSGWNPLMHQQMQAYRAGNL